MNTLRKKLLYMVIAAFVLCTSLPLQAQKYGKGLIFNEVCLNEKEPYKSWIEVYNPTGKTLVLEGFYHSKFRSDNVLPIPLVKKGGIVIKPDEYWIFCASEKQFTDTWGKNKNIVVFKVLYRFSGGGFFRLFTKGLGEAGYDAFRYGIPERSSRYASSYGNQVLNFLKNGKSNSRKKKETLTGIVVSEFFETDPTPGKKNKEK